VIQNTHIRRKNTFIITSINSCEYLIEGNFDIKLGCVTDPIIAYANIINGPFIQLGKDFLGKGLVSNIDIIDNTKDNIIIKVKLYE
jgi:hypothetical protein